MGFRYPHLSLEERRKIAQWLNAKMPIPEMADRLGRAPSTIYRELKRNYYDDEELPELNGYHAVNAQGMYERRRAVHCKLLVHPQVKAAVEDRPNWRSWRSTRRSTINGSTCSGFSRRRSRSSTTRIPTPDPGRRRRWAGERNPPPLPRRTRPATCRFVS